MAYIHWIESLEKKYGLTFAVRVVDLLPPRDSRYPNRIDDKCFDTVDLALEELKPLLSQEALQDHVVWYHGVESPVYKMFIEVVFERNKSSMPPMYTPQAALQIVEDLEAVTGVLPLRPRRGKYRSFYENNTKFEPTEV